jgi:parvulin-like peptidyl-prolyl isomerase
MPANAPFVVVNGEVVPISVYVDRMSLSFAPQIREALIEETLVRAEAKKRGLKAATADVDRLVSKAYGDTLRRYGSEENLAKELQNTRGWSITDYKAVIREQAEPQVLREKIAQSLVKDTEVKDEEISARYDANKEQFSVPATIAISHIMVRRPGDGNADQDAAAKSKAEGLLRQVSADGADFAKIALESSDDKATAARGGKIPTELVRGAHPFGDAFESTVFTSEPGLVKQVVPTPLGYHIVRLDSKKPGRLLTLKEVKDQIKTALLAERRQRAMEELFVQLRTKAKIDTGRF